MDASLPILSPFFSHLPRMLRLARLFLCFFVSHTVLAEEIAVRPTVLRLTLNSAIQAALSKSFAVQVQRFEPKIAQEGVTRELGRFDPVFDISAERLEDSQSDVFANGVHLEQRNVNRVDRFSAGLSGATAIGL